MIFRVGTWDRRPLPQLQKKTTPKSVVYAPLQLPEPTVLLVLCPSNSARKCSVWAGNTIAAVSSHGEAVAWQHLET